MSATPFYRKLIYNVSSFSSGLHLVALTTIILYREGVLALIMAGTTGFTGLHVAHGTLHCTSLEREYLGVAIGTFV